MMSYTVYKLCEHDHKQLLVVQPSDSVSFQLCVYNEHTGTTLMRLTSCTVLEFERAIQLLKSSDQS